MSHFETNRRDFLQSAAFAGCALGAGSSLITPDGASLGTTRKMPNA
jgi:hypothetical protein